MKTIRVVAAVIKRTDEKGNIRFLATQRGYGEFKDKWEFPGGKMEEGETAKEALKREILEELDMKISVGDRIKTVEYDYPTFHLSMDCFMCEIEEGTPILKEHEAARWLDKSSLSSVDWLPADIEIVQILEE
ncbi:MAG: (deoxy)nucleoside triphosphate pyrophosphohydrolase [Lachnospiraceae bacterium]|nr:(deoxy)nucleoside triphosphate pyrophosphohydrolase [Lachnospiraceae bacterium]